MTEPVTIERLGRAIAMTARCMTQHNLPQLLPTLKRLEAERDNLIANGDPIDYAKRLMARIGAEKPIRSPSAASATS
jgi:hypothetical protein